MQKILYGYDYVGLCLVFGVPGVDGGTYRGHPLPTPSEKFQPLNIYLAMSAYQIERKVNVSIGLFVVVAIVLLAMLLYTRAKGT